MKKYNNTLIIVLNWNHSSRTVEFIQNLRSVEKNCDILVIDNGSTVSEKEIIQDYITKLGGAIFCESDITIENTNIINDVFLLLLSKNYGYAKGNNFGLKLSNHLGYSYSLICNNDVLFKSSLINSLEEIMDSRLDVAALGPKVVGLDNKLQGPYSKQYYLFLSIVQLLYPIFLLPWKLIIIFRNFYYSLPRDRIHLVYRLMGCCMMLRNNALEKVDYFDENTFLYCEEMILAEKFKSFYLLTAYTNKIVVVHMHGLSTRDFDNQERLKIFLKSLSYYLVTYRGYSKISLFIIKQMYYVMNNFWLPISRKFKTLFINILRGF
ncbi:glycosyltransferase family 2 protein [Sphaerochaeta halotolerans]|uniref:Glycosyltransferase family 2 protein n=1 Tax=Sphaerochaeta halotolerans TaxID=2293840 RepID=A0A372MF41_9SPIR|nr:glycosyltransferase family 2 protein [Sphaerochaeta halotolerans]RFU93820.1 glycosyltransferase family 2 protein [Sphaerochaeta halotolerans]